MTSSTLQPEERRQLGVDVVEVERVGRRRRRRRRRRRSRRSFARDVVGDEQDVVGAERDRTDRLDLRRPDLQPVLTHDSPPELCGRSSVTDPWCVRGEPTPIAARPPGPGPGARACPMGSTVDVVVVGGGLVGAACAYELGRAGLTRRARRPPRCRAGDRRRRRDPLARVDGRRAGTVPRPRRPRGCALPGAGAGAGGARRAGPALRRVRRAAGRRSGRWRTRRSRRTVMRRSPATRCARARSPSTRRAARFPPLGEVRAAFFNPRGRAGRRSLDGGRARGGGAAALGVDWRHDSHRGRRAVTVEPHGRRTRRPARRSECGGGRDRGRRVDHRPRRVARRARRCAPRARPDRAPRRSTRTPPAWPVLSPLLSHYVVPFRGGRLALGRHGRGRRLRRARHGGGAASAPVGGVCG